MSEKSGRSKHQKDTIASGIFSNFVSPVVKKAKEKVNDVSERISNVPKPTEEDKRRRHKSPYKEVTHLADDNMTALAADSRTPKGVRGGYKLIPNASKPTEEDKRRCQRLHEKAAHLSDDMTALTDGEGGMLSLESSFYSSKDELYRNSFNIRQKRLREMYAEYERLQKEAAELPKGSGSPIPAPRDDELLRRLMQVKMPYPPTFAEPRENYNYTP